MGHMMHILPLRIPAIALFAAVLSAISAPALAHVGPHGTEFGGGLTHPLSGLDHLLAALAVGLLAAQLERPARWLLPIVFPTVMMLGILAALGGPAFGLLKPVIAGSVLILGALIAGGRQPAAVIAVPLVAVFAFLHGYGHGLAAPVQGSLLAYYAGFTAAVVALHGLGLGAGQLAAHMRLRLAARSAGAAIAALGALLLFAA